jgi:hypothetical protein
MAQRARLSQPQLRPSDWPWHTVRSMTIPASVLARADRRLEAENFLSDGYGIRLSLATKPQGQVRLSDLATIDQPNRLKGIQMPEDRGVPFLSATQVFDHRPIVRKWLSEQHVDRLAERFVEAGTILMTCSGNVGRATVATAIHEHQIISHDLLRIQARRVDALGWVYAWLRAPSVRMMMRAERYGHIIKHLEVAHLSALPIVLPDSSLVRSCDEELDRIVSWRSKAHALVLQAEARFAAAFPAMERVSADPWFSHSAVALQSNSRRRLDAAYHRPAIDAIEKRLRAGARAWESIGEIGFAVNLPNRFKRIPAANGAPLIGSAQLFEVNPDIDKRIAETKFGDPTGGRVGEGWLLLARSGQPYGVLGSVAMATAVLADYIVSDDVIRIIPRQPKMRAGYVQLALSHPQLGRPRVKALAYGSSIPHIDVTDVRRLRIPRMAEADERAIHACMVRAAELRAEADLAETDLGMVAERALLAHLSG